MSASPEAATPAVSATFVTCGYAAINGLELYWEQHGTGAGLPIVLLHGGLATLEFPNGPLMEALAEARTVYAIEFQGHGRTANIDRPFTYENLRDDVIAFIETMQLGVVDVVGFSIGGAVSIGVAIARPDLVNKIVPISAGYNGRLRPENVAAVGAMDVAALAGSPVEQAYTAIAPNPEDFATVVANVAATVNGFAGWPEAEVAAYPAPTMIVIGDSDAVTLDDTLAFFRLRGGDVNADFSGEPVNRLAILPGPGHFGFTFAYAPQIVTIVMPWLNA